MYGSLMLQIQLCDMTATDPRKLEHSFLNKYQVHTDLRDTGYIVTQSYVYE